jgi:hypothetical protein
MKYLVTVALLVITSAAGAGVIDDYTVGDYTLIAPGPTMPYVGTDTQYDASGEHILGGRRDVTFEVTAGDEWDPRARVATATSKMAYNSDGGNASVWTTVYGGGGDLNADFTVANGTAFVIELISGDMWSGPRPTPVTITVVSGTGTASVTTDLIAAGFYVVPFSSFAGVDFTDVDMVTMVITQGPANDGVDYSLGSFTTDSTSPVGAEGQSWGSVKALYR